MNHIKLRFHCTRCVWSTKERYGIKVHLLNNHEVPHIKAKLETVFECGICSYRGNTRTQNRDTSKVEILCRFRGAVRETYLGSAPGV